MAWSIAMGIPGFLHQNCWDFYVGVGLRTTPMWMFITKNPVSMVFNYMPMCWNGRWWWLVYIMGPGLYSQDFSWVCPPKVQQACTCFWKSAACSICSMLPGSVQCWLPKPYLTSANERQEWTVAGFHPSRYGRPRPLEWVPHCRGLPTSKDTREVEGESLKLRVPYSWWLNGWKLECFHKLPKSHLYWYPLKWE